MNAASGFETERLVVRELLDSELEAVFAVHVSNPDYLALTSGAGGEPGLFDLEMLRRDFAVAQSMPGRQMAGIFLKQTGEAIGVLDWMEANPSDGMPWIGLVMIRSDLQRQGFATEAFAGLAGLLRDRGLKTIRAGVIERDVAGRALMERLGFHAVSRTVRRMASEEDVLVVERALL